jgi:two-component sensor histidine kinase
VQTASRHKFTDDEIELFSFIVELAAITLEKAQLVHSALIQEMHHRVKNNLQTIAMLLRLQMGENKDLSPQNVLKETINRVLSIATVHEILSETGMDKVGTLDLIKRVTTTVSSNMIDPEADITVTVSGDNVELVSQRATSLVLIANELLQNALEHGMAGRQQGQITITLIHKYGQLRLRVQDDGHGLPEDFDPETDLGLGLDIVRTTVTEDMRGKFFIDPVKRGPGTRVQVTIPLS